MGPAYLWFQLYELEKLGTIFGLTPKEARSAVSLMAEGSAKTLLDSGLSSAEVFDLVPLKPLGENEENIKEIFQVQLKGLFAKLKS